VEKKKYELCLKVLERFHDAGILDGLILIGSWSVFFYQYYFSHRSYSPTIRTRDMDFLVPLPSKMKKKVDIPKLLKDIGFVLDFHSSKGFMRLQHPELIVEFLVPEKGRGSDKPFDLPDLGVNAQALRFLNFLADNIIKIKIEDIQVVVPHPAAFALHKLIVCKRRNKQDKADKDRDQALMIIDFLIKAGEEAHLKRMFNSMPKKWQEKVIAPLRSFDRNDIIGLLK